jgi:hypothetical protein
MKKYTIIFWITTILIFITQGPMELLMFRTPESLAGIAHLGYPLYFLNMLVFFKVLGALVLVIPAVPSRVKEWAYAGFMIDFLAAAISMIAVDGFTAGVIAPTIAIIILILSYVSYHKIHSTK